MANPLTGEGLGWHPRKAPIHLCYPGRVLGLGNSPPVAHVLPDILVNHNFDYCHFSSCSHRPILRLGERRTATLDWLRILHLAG